MPRSVEPVSLSHKSHETQSEQHETMTQYINMRYSHDYSLMILILIQVEYKQRRTVHANQPRLKYFNY